LCRLLNTVGKALDEGRAKGRMNSIYEALDHIRINSDLESRIKFKILDVLDLRRSGWQTRATGPTGPKTIQEIHDDVTPQANFSNLGRTSEGGSRRSATKCPAGSTRIWSWRRKDGLPFDAATKGGGSGGGFVSLGIG
jgi:hypothetical protein